MKMEEHKFQKMVDKKYDDFCVKYGDYFQMKYDEGFMGTTQVLLYIDHKPEENLLPIEKEARADLREFKVLREEFDAMVALNSERAVEFLTQLSNLF
jgi:hypothetical protein